MTANAGSTGSDADTGSVWPGAGRRRFCRLVAAGVGSAWAVGAALAQPGPRIAWLSATTAADGSLFLEALRAGLRAMGLESGRNMVLQAYWGDDSPSLVKSITSQAIGQGADVIVAQGSAAFAVRDATRTIPAVFGFSGDPVEAGLVQTMARPGRNMTGVSYMTVDLIGKRLQLLKEALPAVRRVAVIAFPQHPGDPIERRASDAAAQALGLQLSYYEVRGGGDIGAALGLIEHSGNDAVVAFPIQGVITARERIAQWSIRNRIPVVSGWAQFAQGGNLMTYGPDLRAASYRLASFVDRILRGARPAELPIEQPTKFELVVNMKTARAIGLTIPQALLLRADEVIQ